MEYLEELPCIDLHIHSTFSDGTCTPEEIVSEAKQKKLDLIALTDHNTFKGMDRFCKAVLQGKQKAVAGIEMTSVWNHHEIHVLGYFPIQTDTESVEFTHINRLIQEYADSKYLQLENILENIAEDYPDLSVREFYEYIVNIKPDKNYNRVHIANYLVHKGLAATVKECFQRFLDENQKYYVKRKQITVSEAVEAIKEAGGICVIAHPAEYHFTDEEMKLFFQYCRELSVDGVEAFHPSNTEEEVGRILQTLQKMETEEGSSGSQPFLISTGSDFHGANKVNSMGKGFFYDMEQSEFQEIYEESCRLTYRKLLSMQKKEM